MRQWFNRMHDGLKALEQLVYLIILKGLWHRVNQPEVLWTVKHPYRIEHTTHSIKVLIVRRVHQAHHFASRLDWVAYHRVHGQQNTHLRQSNKLWIRVFSEWAECYHYTFLLVGKLIRICERRHCSVFYFASSIETNTLPHLATS